MPFFIDGYNLLRAIQNTDEEFETLDEAGLCRILSQYLRRIRNRGYIFFDGIGPPDKDRLKGPANLKVRFVGADTDADSVIEEQILADTAPKRLTVVSSDRRIRNAAGKRKATSIGSQDFWTELTRQLNKKNQTPEPKGKRQGITESETDHWLDIFDLDEE